MCDIAVLYLSYTISILTSEDVSAESETLKDRQRVWVHDQIHLQTFDDPDVVCATKHLSNRASYYYMSYLVI